MASHVGGQPARILVVDDDAAILRLLELGLQHEGYTVVTARNGPDALALAQSQAVDLAILDVMMQGMDGLEVCRVLRERPKTANLPIIMLSARSQTKDRIVGLRGAATNMWASPSS